MSHHALSSRGFGAWCSGVLVALALSVAAPQTGAQEIPPPSPDDSLALRIINSVVETFLRTDPPVWEGYDLSTEKTLIYLPGRWTLFLNHRQPVSGYTTYPSHWPRLSVPALFHWGETEELVGQLYFDYQVDTVTTVAVPLYTEVPAEQGPVTLAMFAFVVHEAFHQFQRRAFQDLESFSEEKYPILDAENNALAALEMHLLKEAVRRVEFGDTTEVRELGAMFVAVREHRWGRALPIVRQVERAKELQEGSAKYVETRYVGRLGELCRSGAVSLAEICAHFSPQTVTGYLETDFNRRLRNGALSPEDVPRHRIYPVGASLCLLLDFLNVDWQEKVEEGMEDLTLAGLLREVLKIPESDLSALLDEAKARYDFAGIAKDSRDLIADYERGFEEAFRAFESQPGLCIELELPSSGLSRSRSSRGQRWTVNGGKRVLGEFYVVYTLRRADPALFLEIENTAVLEESVGERRRRVTFHVPAPPVATVDGDSISLETAGRRRLQELDLNGSGLHLTAKGPIELNVEEKSVLILLEPPLTRGN